MHMINRRLTLAILLFNLVSLPATAKMYKWVDEQGKTHYTQSPPPAGTEGESIKPAADISAEQSQESYQRLKDKLDSLSEKDTNANNDDGLSDEEYDRQVKRACDSAKRSLQTFQRNRVNLKNEDGSPRVATEEERQAGIARAEKAIREYCK